MRILHRDLEQVIFGAIMELEDGLTDDIFQEMCQDPDKIAEACDYLIEKLQKYKEDGEF